MSRVRINSVKILVCCLFLLVISGCWDSSSKSLWDTYFATPFSEVRNFRGTAIGWMGYENWFRFESEKEVLLKEKNLYIDVSCVEITKYFLKEFEQDRQILEDTKKLTCLFKKYNAESSLGGYGEYFIHHSPTNTYFLWSWYAH